MGDNLRTNFDTSEVNTLVKLGRTIPSEKIKSISLIETEPALLTTATATTGASIVRPVAGIFDYTQIARYLGKTLSSDAASQEGAKIAVYNGTGAAGLAQYTADALEEKGLGVTTIDNAPDGKYAAYEIYDLTKSDKMPATKKKLEKIYGVSVRTSAAPVAAEDADFVVIVGRVPAGYEAQ